MLNVSYKKRASEMDGPKDNQAQQASMEFRFETELSIVFLGCQSAFYFSLFSQLSYTLRTALNFEV